MIFVTESILAAPPSSEEMSMLRSGPEERAPLNTTSVNNGGYFSDFCYRNCSSCWEGWFSPNTSSRNSSTAAVGSSELMTPLRSETGLAPPRSDVPGDSTTILSSLLGSEHEGSDQSSHDSRNDEDNSFVEQRDSSFFENLFQQSLDPALSGSQVSYRPHRGVTYSPPTAGLVTPTSSKPISYQHWNSKSLAPTSTQQIADLAAILRKDHINSATPSLEQQGYLDPSLTQLETYLGSNHPLLQKPSLQTSFFFFSPPSEATTLKKLLEEYQQDHLLSHDFPFHQKYSPVPSTPSQDKSAEIEKLEALRAEVERLLKESPVYQAPLTLLRKGIDQRFSILKSGFSSDELTYYDYPVSMIPYWKGLLIQCGNHHSRLFYPISRGSYYFPENRSLISAEGSAEPPLFENHLRSIAKNSAFIYLAKMLQLASLVPKMEVVSLPEGAFGIAFQIPQQTMAFLTKEPVVANEEEVEALLDHFSVPAHLDEVGGLSTEVRQAQQRSFRLAGILSNPTELPPGWSRNISTPYGVNLHDQIIDPEGTPIVDPQEIIQLYQKGVVQLCHEEIVDSIRDLNLAAAQLQKEFADAYLLDLIAGAYRDEDNMAIVNPRADSARLLLFKNQYSFSIKEMIRPESLPLLVDASLAQNILALGPKEIGLLQEGLVEKGLDDREVTATLSRLKQLQDYLKNGANIGGVTQFAKQVQEWNDETYQQLTTIIATHEKGATPPLHNYYDYLLPLFQEAAERAASGYRLRTKSGGGSMSSTVEI